MQHKETFDIKLNLNVKVLWFPESKIKLTNSVLLTISVNSSHKEENTINCRKHKAPLHVGIKFMLVQFVQPEANFSFLRTVYNISTK